MAIIKASITQARVLGLLKKEFDGTYDMAARLLEAMGLPKNGVPVGKTPGEVKKMKDAELLALLPQADTTAEVVTAEEAKSANRSHWAEVKASAKEWARDREIYRKDSQELSDKLRRHGWYWVWWDEEAGEAFGRRPWEKDRWVLMGPGGQILEAVLLPELISKLGIYPNARQERGVNR